MENFILTTPTDLQELISAAVRSELADLKISQERPAATEYLTRRQTAKLLQVSLPTLSKWYLTGTIQGYRIGGRIRFKSNEVESAMQAMKTIKNRGL